MSDLFDLNKAREERDLGMTRATQKEESERWKNEFMFRIRTLPRGHEGTAEEIRRFSGVSMPPHSPNAIGATINAAVRAGLLEWTGAMKSPQSVKSHARKTQVWRRT